MAESWKETASSAGPKEKKSSFDDDIGNDFLGSWKSLSVAKEDTMDFSFDTVSTGKKKPFNFDNFDIDFNLDGDFNKLTSFKADMPDLDFSSPSKEIAKPKESSRGESFGGTHQGKRERFNLSFDFNDMLDFDLDSTLTEGKKISPKNSDIKDGGVVGIEQECSKLNMADSNEAFDILPASDNATVSVMETAVDSASGPSDASNDKFSSKAENIEELVSKHNSQTSPQKTPSVSPKDEYQQIYFVEKAKSTQPVALETTQVLPAQSFDKDESTQATESGSTPSFDAPAPKVNTDSVEDKIEAGRKTDFLGSDHGNLQLNNSDPQKKRKSGSNKVVSEKADSESPGENMVGAARMQDDNGTAQMQDDLESEVISAGTLPHVRSHSDAIKDIQKPTSILSASSRSEHAEEKVIPNKENEPEVGSSKILRISNVTEPQLRQPSLFGVQFSSTVDRGPTSNEKSSNILQNSIETKTQLCQPSSVGVRVSSEVNKGLPTSYPVNGKREGIHVNDAEKQRKLTGDLKSLSVDLKKGELAFLGSKRNANDLCNIRGGSDGDGVKTVSKLGTIPRLPDKEATTKGGSILLGSEMNNKDLKNFGGKFNSASSTDTATNSNIHKRVDSTTVVSSTISIRNLKIKSSEGLKTGWGTSDLSSLKNSRNMGARKNHFDATTLERETGSLRNSEKDTEVQGSTMSNNLHPVERKTSPLTSLKRKTSEELKSNSNQVLLHPQKRLSPSPIESRNLKEPLSTVEVQCNQPENITKTMLYDQRGSGVEIPNAKEDNILMTMENDQHVEKAEEYAKELEDMCNMLKKKHEEAKELLVRSIVNNNRLLMLNHPMFDAKIQKVKKFAAQLVSRYSF